MTNIFESITHPTLILDEKKARRNLESISNKIENQNILFRPHFKTHQSAKIGSWFLERGIRPITVSSVEMATYFARHGWNDILIAFPVNLREIDAIASLAKTTSLSLLVEDLETIEQLNNHLVEEVELRVKVDVGARRSGVDWNQPQKIIQIVDRINSSPRLKFGGLLTHAGHSYRAHGVNEVVALYAQTLERMQSVQLALLENGVENVRISVGDTPTTSLVQNLGDIDEIRPGNFLFYDMQQFKIGSCSLEQIAVCVTCPIVAIHKDRDEIVVYGGAIHFSKDYYARSDGSNGYGLAVGSASQNWDCNNIIGEVKSLSQEHGVIKCLPGKAELQKTGDLLCILPAHSCLTVQAMRTYTTLDGQIIQTLNSEC